MADIEFMDMLGSIGQLLGAGSSLKNILSGDGLTIADIRTSVREEVERAFFRESADNEILTAAAALQTAQDYLAIDYLDAQNAGESKAELWSKLDTSGTTPQLANLEQALNTFQSWLDQVDDHTKAKALPVCVGLHLYICLYHQQRSLVAPDTATANAELADMHKRASQGAALRSVLDKMVTARQSELEYVQANNTLYNMSGLKIVGDSMTDHWFDGAGVNTLYSWKYRYEGGDDFRTALQLVMTCTKALLSSGNNDNANALWGALESDCLKKLPMLGNDTRDDFRGLTFSAVLQFGQWAEKARNVLNQMDKLAT